MINKKIAWGDKNKKRSKRDKKYDGKGSIKICKNKIQEHKEVFIRLRDK